MNAFFGRIAETASKMYRTNWGPTLTGIRNVYGSSNRSALGGLFGSAQLGQMSRGMSWGSRAYLGGGSFGWGKIGGVAKPWIMGSDFGPWNATSWKSFNKARAGAVGARGALGYAALDLVNPFGFGSITD